MSEEAAWDVLARFYMGEELTPAELATLRRELGHRFEGNEDDGPEWLYPFLAVEKQELRQLLGMPD